LKAWTRIQQWEGVVQDVTEDGFTARLTQAQGSNDFATDPSFADFSFAELWYPSERARIKPGRPFYWTLGLRKETEGGNQSYSSLVRLKREVPIGRLRLRRAEAEARRILGLPDAPK